MSEEKQTYKESGLIEHEHEGVVNQEAYKQWKVMMALPILNEKKFFVASDGVTYNVAFLAHQLQAKIAHLPQKEQNIIMMLKQSYYNAINNANVLKRQAFKQTGKGGYDNYSILDGKKEQIISLFGKMFTMPEVLDICNTEFKLATTLEALQQFKKRNAESIAIQIEEYKKTLQNKKHLDKTPKSC